MALLERVEPERKLGVAQLDGALSSKKVEALLRNVGLVEQFIERLTGTGIVDKKQLRPIENLIRSAKALK